MRPNKKRMLPAGDVAQTGTCEQQGECVGVGSTHPAGKAHGPGSSQANGGGALCPDANSERFPQKHWGKHTETWSLERILAVGGRRVTGLDHPEMAGDE